MIRNNHLAQERISDLCELESQLLEVIELYFPILAIMI